MHDFEQKYITPSPGPRIIVFNICITPLLAPSVRNMSSGSLSFREDNAHLLVYNLKTKLKEVLPAPGKENKKKKNGIWD